MPYFSEKTKIESRILSSSLPAPPFLFFKMGSMKISHILQILICLTRALVWLTLKKSNAILMFVVVNSQQTTSPVQWFWLIYTFGQADFFRHPACLRLGQAEAGIEIPLCLYFHFNNLAHLEARKIRLQAGKTRL